MTVASELQDAARAIDRQTPPDASFHRAVGKLLNQIALTAPTIEGARGELHLPPITRLALTVARSYIQPTGSAVPVGSAELGTAQAGAGVAASAPATQHTAGVA